METRFPRPDPALAFALVSRAVNQAGGRISSTDEIEWVEHGSSALIALHGDVAVRIARQPELGAELVRVAELLALLPELPFAVPHPLADPVELDGYLAVPTRRIHGTNQPPERLDPGLLIELMDAIHSVPLEPLAPKLATPRAFMGGDDWLSVLTHRVLPLIDPTLQVQAQRRITALAALPDQPRALNHGDLGRMNILWANNRIAGVIDWDLAAEEDPAEDVAAVGSSFDCWTALAGRLDEGVVARAEVFRQSFGLQIVAFAVINNRSSGEVARSVARAERNMLTG